MDAVEPTRTPIEAVLEALLVIEQQRVVETYRTKGAMQIAWSRLTVARREHRASAALRAQAEEAGREYSRAFVAHQEALRILVAARAAAACPSLPAGVNVPLVEG